MNIHIESDGTPLGTTVTDAETGEEIICDRLTMEMDLSTPEAVVIATGISMIRVTKINGFFEAGEDELLRLRDAVQALFRAYGQGKFDDCEAFVRDWEFHEQSYRRHQEERQRKERPQLRSVE